MLTEENKHNLTYREKNGIELYQVQLIRLPLFINTIGAANHSLTKGG